MRQYIMKTDERTGQVICSRPDAIRTDTGRTGCSWFTAVLMGVLLVLVIIAAAVIRAEAEDDSIRAWILCKPSNYTNIRMTPSKRATVVGYLDPCDEIEIDGETENGFVHITYPTDGWVYAGYVTTEEPEAVGETYFVAARNRVAARRWIEGPQISGRPWLVNGTELQVFFMTSEWAVTSRGYIRSEWLEADPI